jgi:DinB superfamily
MIDKQQILTMLHDEYTRWESILASLHEAQITSPQLDDGWSVKDVIAHLRAWQQRSIARMEAALNNHEPHFPEWPSTVGQKWG